MSRQEAIDEWVKAQARYWQAMPEAKRREAVVGLRNVVLTWRENEDARILVGACMFVLEAYGMSGPERPGVTKRFQVMAKNEDLQLLAEYAPGQFAYPPGLRNVMSVLESMGVSVAQADELSITVDRTRPPSQAERGPDR